MLDLRLNKKEDSGWVRLTKYKDVFLVTLYGNNKVENKLKIKFSNYMFAIIDKPIRDIIKKKPKEIFILDFENNFKQINF